MNPQPARPKANVTLTRSSRHVSWKPNLAGELLAPGPAAVSARGPEAGPPPRPRCRWRVTGTGLPASTWPLRCSGPCVPFQTWLHEELGAGRGPGHRLGSESAASRGSQGPVLSGSMPGRVLPQGLCICCSRGLERPPRPRHHQHPHGCCSRPSKPRGVSQRDFLRPRPPCVYPREPARTHMNPHKTTRAYVSPHEPT